MGALLSPPLGGLDSHFGDTNHLKIDLDGFCFCSAVQFFKGWVRRLRKIGCYYTPDHSLFVCVFLYFGLRESHLTELFLSDGGVAAQR